MATTLLYGDAAFVSDSALARDENLWISLDDLTAATGWERKPQGLCRGDLCVPIPPDRKAAFVSPDDRFNLAEFARYREQPVVHDDAAGVWVFGEAASARRDALRSLAAPDFRLPRRAALARCAGLPFARSRRNVACALRLSRQESSAALVGLVVRL